MPHFAVQKKLTPRIALVGVHGFGEQHLKNLDRLSAEEKVELIAVADPNPPAAGRLSEEVKVFATLAGMIEAGVSADVVIVSTPIHTHTQLSVMAMEAGADVYVEKPTAPSWEQFQTLMEASERTGRAVQVGFQSLGSLALPALEKLMADGSLGAIRGVSATGTWLRNKAYFQRSRWAGKRILDGIDVMDGVATNPLAHAVATALHVAGIRSVADVESITTDLFRAHEIEGDDTSAIRITQAAGPSVLAALTLCAPEQTDPYITVTGTKATAVFHYTLDELRVSTTLNTGEKQEDLTEFGRVNLLENLLQHRENGTPLLSSLADSGAFMQVVEAIRRADAPTVIAEPYVSWLGSELEAHPVITDIVAWVERAAAAQATFTELAAPWVKTAPLLQFNDGSNVQPTLSPRPFIHPVTTLGGVRVSDAMPMDHLWHLGVGVALQDVNGVNFWGGRTYRREAGAYVWRPDHGRISLVSSQTHDADASSGAPVRSDELLWTGPDGTDLLREKRETTWKPVQLESSGRTISAWQLTLRFTLTPAGDSEVSLGSPGSNGREAGGYGGYFFRLPPVSGQKIFTGRSHTAPAAHGEANVHGAVAAWLAWSGNFGGSPDQGVPHSGPGTLIFTAPPEAYDPWFVRSEGYPGVGSALAWDSAVVLAPGEELSRTISVTLADGLHSESTINDWMKSL